MLEDTSATNDGGVVSSAEQDLGGHWNRVIGRRAFLRGAGVAGATALAGSGFMAAGVSWHWVSAQMAACWDGTLAQMVL